MKFRISRCWKWGAALLPVVGISAWAAFTSPPFGGYPSQTAPMLWQCYSGLVERTAAVCTVLPYHPVTNGYHSVTNFVHTNILPSRTHWYLVQLKTATASLITDNWWAHSAWGVNATNRINLTNICAISGVGLDFWTNTPPAGMSTATNGWNGLRRVITNLKWTVHAGDDEAAYIVATNTVIHSNVVQYLNGAYCDTAPFEADFDNFTDAGGGWDVFPLYEVRDYNPVEIGTNKLYQYRRDHWFMEDGVPCDTEPNYVGYSSQEACAPLAVLSNDSINCVMGDLSGNRDVYVWTLTNTVGTNACAMEISGALAACLSGWENSTLASHVAPITFSICTNQIGTNVVTQSLAVWVNSGATGMVYSPGNYVLGGTFTDPFGLSMNSNGWAEVAVTVTNGFTAVFEPKPVVDTFSTARVPWAGNASTNSIAWFIYDARLVRKWKFDY